jgi:hypothetical protein
MVPGLAFLATAVATLFAQATLQRSTSARKPHELAWTVALLMFAVASAALALGASTGWDNGTFRVFYLFGAVLNVPWLALGTLYLLFGLTIGRRTQWVLVFISGLASGVLFTAPIKGPLPHSTIPVGSDVFGVFPRVLAATGSGVAAMVIFVGAIYSAIRFARRRTEPGAARMAAANGLIALGTLVLSSGGLVQGVVGHDEAFTLSVAVGISVVYAGFLVASVRPATATTPRAMADPALPDLAT